MTPAASNSVHIAAACSALRQCSAEVEEKFSGLSTEQLNWKPTADAWSIAQCLDHLMVSNKLYFPRFDAIARNTHRMSFYERLPVLPAFFGKMLIHSLKNPKMKTKTVRTSEPHISAFARTVIAEFRRENEKLIEKIQSVKDRDLRTVRVTSAIASLVTYSVRDMITVLLVHEQRHIAQAERVMTMAGFPASGSARK
jgi:uncharacterized damage-inducible protein DinB